MSKAFVREEASSSDANVDEETKASRRGSPYISKAGYDKLQRALDQLWHVDRPAVAKQVGEAAAQGDRSENAEYIYGKKKLREIDKKIRF
jgi:transcription elongation factor GreB